MRFSGGGLTICSGRDNFLTRVWYGGCLLPKSKFGLFWAKFAAGIKAIASSNNLIINKDKKSGVFLKNFKKSGRKDEI